MLVKFGAAGALLIALTCSAAAQGMCGDPPIAPMIPSPADMRNKPAADAEAARNAAFQDIRRWQGALKSYRACLVATVDTDKRNIGEVARSDKPDKDKIASLQKEITASNAAYDSSVDDEERVVNQWNAAGTAYCLRSGVDHATCPKT
ncbi:MAG: hypothetical protein ACREHF_12500 [Rhizomicrobium sp.]